MCAPGSKAWTRRLHWAHSLLIVALWVGSTYLSLRRDLANVVAGIVACEADYLLTGVIPAFAPSKFVLPPCPLLDAELSNVQHYVALLAAHDLEADCATAPFAVAAFDLATSRWCTQGVRISPPFYLQHSSTCTLWCCMRQLPGLHSLGELCRTVLRLSQRTLRPHLPLS